MFGNEHCFALSGLTCSAGSAPQGDALGWLVAAPSGRTLHAVTLLVSLLFFIIVRSANAADAPLADAAEKADWPRVRDVLKQHPDANAAQVDGMTALHWAAYHDDVETTKRLLAAGANAKAENRYGVAPLSLACTNGNVELVRLLLAAEADPNTTLRGGETALMTAARTGRVGPVRALLDAGAKVNAKDRNGQTPLMWAAAEGHAEVVELLIKSGADMHARLKSGFTPLLFAAREGRIEVVQTLLKAEVDANEAIETEKGGGRAPINGTSALLLAVENAHFELAVVLLKAGANPNEQRSGFTPLHALTWVRKPNRGDSDDGQPPPAGSGNLTSLQFVRELVSRGADVNTRLAKGDSGRGKLSMVGATPFLLASKTADVAYLRLLVELKADPLLPNKDGCTPLMAASGIGTLAPTEEAGTEPEALAAVDYLLSLGADINTVDQNGETAMHGAAYKSLPKMVQFLTDKGAKIDVWNRKNKYGWTPLLIAEGFRPGNFKPSTDTIDAIHRVMRAAGVTPPPPTPRPAVGSKGYDAKQPGN
ncbi:MAG: ankyrin repeat domain-containing protein [Planctomycetaceae bacterium]|nr:ankyrin repeat domain-containing protein [Planctomycetaceae bacterium]